MVAIASPKRRSAPDVQESELPEVCFYAERLGGSIRIFIQIRKKNGKDTFAVFATGESIFPFDEKMSREDLEKVLKTGKICSRLTIKIDHQVSVQFKKILAMV